MGYQIVYHLQEVRQTKLKKQMPIWGKAVLLAVCMVAVHFLFALLQTAAGGQWQETIAASEHMAEVLQQGMSLTEAVQVFCAELLS